MIPGNEDQSEPSDEDKLLVVITKDEILGRNNIPLLEKTKDLFVKKGLCSESEQTAFLVTAFDREGFNISQYQSKVIWNVLMKPFDDLILKEHISYAVAGRHPPSSYGVANMKTSALIEMLKDVDIESISDVGFITKSYLEIPPGQIAKYYGKDFEIGDSRSVLAVCLRSEPHPSFPGAFRCAFSYFGASVAQISHLRKQVNLPGDSFDYLWRRPLGLEKLKIAVVGDPSDENNLLSGSFERVFSNCEAISYRTMDEFMLDVDPEQKVHPKQEKAFPVDFRFKIIVDLFGKQIYATDSDLAQKDHVLGHSAEEFYKKDLISLIEPHHHERLLKMLKSEEYPKTEDPVLEVLQNNLHFLIRMESKQIVKDGDGNPAMEFSFTELDPSERREWFSKTSKIGNRLDAVIAHERYFKGKENLDKWSKVKEILKEKIQPLSLRKKFNLPLFMICPKPIDEMSYREMSHIVSDVFHLPMDRNYIPKKVTLFVPDLKPVEDMIIKNRTAPQLAEVANPITVTSISEAGLVMEYYRSISLGGLRKFILWYPIEAGLPVILGSCNFREQKSSDGKTWENHFVFFGATDHFLKHIRVWIRDNYISEKNKS